MGLKEDLAKQQAEIDRKLTLAGKYPDLSEHRARFRTVLKALSANAVADDSYVSASCGCCNDAALYLWVRVKADGVYSDPPFFVIGEKVPNYDLDGTYERRYFPEVIDQLRKHGVSEAVVAKAAAIVEAQKEDE